jgi:hypothetical protein
MREALTTRQNMWGCKNIANRKKVEVLSAKICLTIHFSYSEEQKHNSGLNDS